MGVCSVVACEARMTITLRQDQAALKNDVHFCWQTGARNVLAVLPTGGGKSIIVSDDVLENDQMRRRQAVLAHRTELVGQMSMHVARRGVPHRLIAPKQVIADVTREHREEFGRSFVNPTALCAVGGVDTLISRATELAPWAQQIERWTIDEAHHVLRANKWGRAVAMFPNAWGLGVTASPSRADGMGLGSHHDGVFDAMVCGPTMRELIRMRALTDYQIVVPQDGDFEIDEDDVTESGDFSTAKMKKAAEKSHIVGDVVKEYIRWAHGKRGITFAIDVEEANKIAQAYNDAGIPAAAVSAKTPAATRAEYVRRLRSGQLWQLVNVDLFGEGFDLPAIEVVSMARPTASLAVYLQQFGRALRTLAGKAYGLIIDHVSNYKRHGLPDRHRLWTLDRRDKRAKRAPDPEAIELTSCRQCSMPYERCLTRCPHCSALPPLPSGGRSVEAVDGDLMLLDAATLAQMRGETVLESAESLRDRAMYAAGPAAAGARFNSQSAKIEAQSRLAAALAQWAGWQRYRGREDRESYKRFYLATGMDVASAMHRDRSAAEYEATAALVESWCG